MRILMALMFTFFAASSLSAQQGIMGKKLLIGVQGSLGYDYVGIFSEDRGYNAARPSGWGKVVPFLVPEYGLQLEYINSMNTSLIFEYNQMRMGFCIIDESFYIEQELGEEIPSGLSFSRNMNVRQMGIGYRTYGKEGFAPMGFHATYKFLLSYNTYSLGHERSAENDSLVEDLENLNAIQIGLEYSFGRQMVLNNNMVLDVSGSLRGYLPDFGKDSLIYPKDERFRSRFLAGVIRFNVALKFPVRTSKK